MEKLSASSESLDAFSGRLSARSAAAHAPIEPPIEPCQRPARMGYCEL